MRFSSKNECESTRKFNAFASTARPMAMQIAKGQNLFNATFPDNERVENVLDDLFIKYVDTPTWNLLMSNRGYLRSTLRHELNSPQPYDRDRRIKVVVSDEFLRTYSDGEDADPASADNCAPEEDYYTREHMLYMPEEETATDAYDCFLKAISTAYENLSRKEALILDKGRYEAIKVSGKLRDDEEAFCLHREKGLGKLVVRSMKDAEIASILGMTGGSVRARRTELKKEFAEMVREEFDRLYHGPDGDGEFHIYMKRHVGGAAARGVINKRKQVRY